VALSERCSALTSTWIASTDSPMSAPMGSLFDQLRTGLQGQYEVDAQIGCGGMATVFRARDVKHDRTVAIKVLRPDLSASIGAERFEREIKTASRLAHPNILPVYDSGETAGLLYYVMPFVDGESLRDQLDREGQLSPADAIRIAAEVAGALAYAHAQGVIHRDIKPENVLLQSGHAVVADFGIACRSTGGGNERLTTAGTSLGTAAYMSPEQAAGDVVDARSDLYSLACTLYEMLTGQAPYTGLNAAAVLARHALEAVPFVRIVRPTVSERVEVAVRRALAKVPDDRFESMDAFRCALLAERPTRTSAQDQNPRIVVAPAGTRAGRIVVAVRRGVRGRRPSFAKTAQLAS
jgi:eukaryotic-like serine/threonine-protein kinase